MPPIRVDKKYRYLFKFSNIEAIVYVSNADIETIFILRYGIYYTIIASIINEHIESMI